LVYFSPETNLLKVPAKLQFGGESFEHAAGRIFVAVFERKFNFYFRLDRLKCAFKILNAARYLRHVFVDRVERCRNAVKDNLKFAELAEKRVETFSQLGLDWVAENTSDIF